MILDYWREKIISIKDYNYILFNSNFLKFNYRAQKTFLELIQADIPAIEQIFPQITRLPIKAYRNRYKLVNAVKEV